MPKRAVTSMVDAGEEFKKGEVRPPRITLGIFNINPPNLPEAVLGADQHLGVESVRPAAVEGKDFIAALDEGDLELVMAHLHNRPVSLNDQFIHHFGDERDHKARVKDPGNQGRYNILIRHRLHLGLGAVLGNVVEHRLERGGSVGVRVGAPA